MSRVQDMPVYQQQTIEISAAHYNLWRRLRAHFPLPFRIPLSGLRSLALIIDRHEWVCVDEALNDMPVICWDGFDDKGRDALHLPVRCTLKYYHFAAAKIQVDVIEKMQQAMQDKIRNAGSF